jgi:hypothetical protein
VKVLVGCESSGVVRDAMIALGHEALSADFKPTERPGPHYQGDIFDVIDYPWDLAIVHIPCTHTSNSGAKHFAAKKMDGRHYANASLWLRAWKATAHIPKVCFEHPMSVMSTLFRKRDQAIQPHEFWNGDGEEPGKGEVKTTWLWLRGLPPLVPTTPDEPGRIQAVWKMGPSDTRAEDRARTYTGIARAFAEQFAGSAAARMAA